MRYVAIWHVVPISHFYSFIFDDSEGIVKRLHMRLHVKVAVQRVKTVGASHSRAASDSASVSRNPLQQDDQHNETSQQTNPATHVRCRRSFVRMSFQFSNIC